MATTGSTIMRCMRFMSIFLFMLFFFLFYRVFHMKTSCARVYPANPLKKELRKTVIKIILYHRM